MEPAPDAFDPSPLDWQVEAAERAGKQVIIAVGAVKNFGYPEFFCPQATPPDTVARRLAGRRVVSSGAAGGCTQIRGPRREEIRHARLGGDRQVEHEAVDPLGVEHSWRLTTGFVKREMAEVKRLDPEAADPS